MSIEIKTKRLSLRLLKEEDINYLAELDSDPEVRKFFPEGIQNLAQIEARIKEFVFYYKEMGLPCFLIFLLESGEFIGRCGFGPVETGEIEVGYLIHKKFWGQGYASEVLAEFCLGTRKY